MDADVAQEGRATAMADFRPLYTQVKDMMIQRIGSGAWKYGELIPSEFQLAAEFGVSQGTVRKALLEMEAQNLVVRRQGRGTYVAEHSRRKSLFHFFHIVDLNGVKELPTSVILECRTRRATREQAADLKLPARASVLNLTRVRHVRGQPILLERIAVPVHLFPNLNFPVGQELPDELYVLYQRDHGVTVVRADERLSAVIADAEDVQNLGVPEGTPLLEIARTAFDVHGSPVERRISRCNTQKHRYFSEIV